MTSAKDSIYAHFEKVVTVPRFHCKHCSTMFIGPTISIFQSHIAEKHPVENKFSKTRVEPYQPFEFDYDEWVGALVTFMVECDVSFMQSIESTAFKELIHCLNGDVIIPSRDTIIQRIQEMYPDEAEDIIEKLNRSSASIYY